MSRPTAIVIGTSAGGLDALSALLPGLPAGYGLPLLIVVHLPPARDSILAELLQAKCAIVVHEAEDKEPILPGTAYLAPPDYHLLVEPDRRLSLSSEEAVNYSRPSIDVLFESAADAFGPELIGMILTGANDDGARGLRAVLDHGGTGLVQCPETAQASAMPRAALAACPELRPLTLKQIADYLEEVARVHE